MMHWISSGPGYLCWTLLCNLGGLAIGYVLGRRSRRRQIEQEYRDQDEGDEQ